MLAKILKELRQDNDITQAELAEYLNITQSTYSGYESGKIKTVPLELLIKLVDYYNLSLDYLVQKEKEYKK